MKDKDNKSSDNYHRIKELERKLKKKETEIKLLNEQLNNNKEIIKDIIQEKEFLNKQIQDFKLKEINFKLNKYKELQQEHHKTEHRLVVTKKLLEEAREKIIDQKEIIQDLENRGIIDYILRRYPESFLEYKEKE